MRTLGRFACLVAFGVISGCAKDGTSATAPSSLPNGGTTSDLAFCVSETNRYRAMVGAKPLSESSSIEAFAAAAAQADTASGIAHGYYLAHAPANSAENESNLPLVNPTQTDVSVAIESFWSEGPSGGHYQNIVGPYSQLGCGLFVSGGRMLIVQDFR